MSRATGKGDVAEVAHGMRWLRAALAGAGGAAVLLSCSPDKPARWPARHPVGAAAVLTGHLLHPTGPTVALKYGPDWLSGEDACQATARLSPTGYFRLRVPAAALGAAWLYHGQQYTPLYLAQGDSLHLTLDARRLDETVRYTGPAAAPSNYLAQRLLRFENDAAEDQTPIAQAETSTPAAMRAYADAYRQRQTAFLDSFARRFPLPAAFRASARRAIAYGWAHALQSYPLIQQQYRRAHQLLPRAPLPASYFDFRRQLPLANDSALATEQYRRYLGAYAQSLGLADSLRPGPQPFAAVTRLLGAGRSADFVVAQLLYDKLEVEGPGAVGRLLPAYQRQARDSALVRTIRERCRRLLGVQPGRSAPDFTLRDEAGRFVSLHDFRGRVVYLDFWASWCGPCVAEAPALARLRQRFAGRDVVFLAISVDHNPTAWRRALSRLHLRSPNARHLIEPYAFEAKSLLAYEVRAFPRTG